MNIHLPHDLEIPLLDMYPRETLEHVYSDTYTRTLVTAKNKTKNQKPKTKQKTWKPLVPPKEKWKNKLWYIHIGILHGNEKEL